MPVTDRRPIVARSPATSSTTSPLTARRARRPRPRGTTTVGSPPTAPSEARSKWSAWPCETTTRSISPSAVRSGTGPWRSSGPRRCRRNGSVRTRAPPTSSRTVAWPTKWTPIARRRSSTGSDVASPGPSGAPEPDHGIAGAARDATKSGGMPQKRHGATQDRACGCLDQVGHRVVVREIHALGA